MRKWNNIFLFCSLLIVPIFGYAQNLENEFETALEEALELLNNGEDANLQDAEFVAQQLANYYKYPLNLNYCSAEELNNFPLLNPIQKNALLSYKKKYGTFLNWYDVYRVEGIGQREIRLLKVFASLQEEKIIAGNNLISAWKDASKEFSVIARRDLSEKVGYQSSNEKPAIYPGNAWKNYSRLRIYSPNKFSVGLLMEKDPGEQFIANNQPEFATGHLFFEGGKGWVKSFVLGDYQMHAGQDLTIGPAFAFSKSSNLTSIHRSGKKFRPNTSVSENSFFRGAAVTLQRNQWELTLAANWTQRDANIDSLGNILSLPLSGLHRTASEIENKDQSTFISQAAILEKHWNKLKFGASFSNYFHATPMQQKVAESQGNFAGTHYEYALEKGLLFGEVSMDVSNQKFATVQGILLSLHPKLNFAATYRNYPYQWQNAIGNPFSGYGRGTNERGLYTGFEYAYSKKWIVNLYADQQTNLGPDSRTNTPTADTDLFLQIKYFRKRNMTIYGRIRHRISPTDYVVTEESRFLDITEPTKNNVRLHSDFTVSKEVTLRYRLEFLFNKKLNLKSVGKLFYQDLAYKPLDSKFDFMSRFAWFQTQSYNERIYAYENDLLYTYSVPPYYGKGIRYYFKMRYKLSYKLDFWMRYSTWVYNNRNTIGSGNEQISGNRDPEIAFMFRYSF